MSKRISVALRNSLTATGSTLATCWRIVRTDGQVFGFTDHDRDIAFDGITYKARTGHTATGVETKADTSVDNLEVNSIVDDVEITDDDVLKGLWDHAEVEILAVDYEDMDAGAITLRYGTLGELAVEGDAFTAEIRGLLQRFKRREARIYTPLCRADLGDAKCEVRLSPPLWQATTAYTAVVAGDAALGDVVAPTAPNGRRYHCTTAGTSGGSEPTWNLAIDGTTSDGTVVWTTKRAFEAVGAVDSFDAAANTIDDADYTDWPDDWFTGGLLTWTGGANDGLKQEVRAFAAGAFTLALPPVFAVDPGDAFIVQAGCQKRFTEDCIGIFDNHLNFRGEPHLPGADQMLLYPDAV